MTRPQSGPRRDVERKSRTLGFEPHDAPARPVILGLAGVVALAVLVAGLVALGFAGFDRVAPAPIANALERAALQPMAPRLQTAPRRDRARIEAAATARLRGYGWSDQNPGAARIPIERAMKLQAAQGWPDAGGRP